MKVRTGFVSNSSSSSFVMLGIEMSYAEVKEKFGEEYYEYLEDSDLEYFGEGAEVIGIPLVDVSDDGGYLERNIYTMEDLYEKSKKVAALLGISPSDIKIITGTRMS